MTYAVVFRYFGLWQVWDYYESLSHAIQICQGVHHESFIVADETFLFGWMVNLEQMEIYWRNSWKEPQLETHHDWMKEGF